MGKASFLMVMGLAMVAGIFGAMMNRNATSSVQNYTSYYSQVAARNANNAALELGLKQLSDSLTWRAGYPKITIAGTDVSLRVDSVQFVDKNGISRSGLKLTSKSAYYSDSLLTHLDTLTATVIVQAPAIPRGIRAAYTAQGPIDHTISNMYIDGENHDTTQIRAEDSKLDLPALYQPIAGSGKYGVSTSASTFVNTQQGFIGGTDTTVKPYADIAPAFPNSPKVIELNSFPGGFPKTPDAALELDEGTLKSVAQSGAFGSHYITTTNQLAALVSANKPLSGVTYIELVHVKGDDTSWGGQQLPDGSGGILVFHSPNGTASWSNISFPTKTEAFKGIMVFDYIFHIHMNILGALIELTPWTEISANCGGNAEKTIAYCGPLITKYMNQVRGASSGGGWRGKLKMYAWYE